MGGVSTTKKHHDNHIRRRCRRRCNGRRRRGRDGDGDWTRDGCRGNDGGRFFVFFFCLSFFTFTFFFFFFFFFSDGWYLWVGSRLGFRLGVGVGVWI